MFRLVYAILGFTILPLLLLPGCTNEENTKPTITVVGRAEIIIPPDYLTAYLSVTTLDMDPVKAKKVNNDKVRSILSLVEELGIASKDIATGHVGLNKSFKRGGDFEEIFEGYQAETSIQVTIRDLQLYDRFIDESLKLGLNRIWGISFKSTEIVEKHREARKAAIRAAKEKATYLAAELGQGIGPAVSITSGESSLPISSRNAVTSNTIRYSTDTGGFSENNNTQTIMPDGIIIREEVRVEFRLKEGI